VPATPPDCRAVSTETSATTVSCTRVSLTRSRPLPKRLEMTVSGHGCPGPAGSSTASQRGGLGGGERHVAANDDQPVDDTAGSSTSTRIPPLPKAQTLTDGTNRPTVSPRSGGGRVRAKPGNCRLRDAPRTPRPSEVPLVTTRLCAACRHTSPADGLTHADAVEDRPGDRYPPRIPGELCQLPAPGGPGAAGADRDRAHAGRGDRTGL
jgi:hypothetical protein